jgi:hypothetical protein
MAQNLEAARVLIAKLEFFAVPYVRSSAEALKKIRCVHWCLEALLAIDLAAMFNWGGVLQQRVACYRIGAGTSPL